ncbi:MAG: hypothetical protein JO300_15035 [Silvibacterium sp.]|nr:hypothetical protein [Silvibacterium sp.]MBV8437664.1 hypothetical protein [Silvibacterium sp.]
MRVDLPLDSFLETIESRLLVLPLSKEAAKLGAALPDSFPADPCDRFITGTAIAQDVPLVTIDSRIRESRAVRTIW